MQRRAVFDQVLDRQLRSISSDGICVFLLERGNLRGALLHGSYLVNQMRANHRLGILETLVLGHAYIAVGLLTSQLKGSDRIYLNISCTGPAKGVSVESTAEGEIRGYLKQNPFPLDDVDRDFDIRSLLREGDLSIIKYLEDAKYPFTSQVRMRYGSIAEDLASYFYISEQMPTAFNLSVKFDKDGRAIGAGGLFIQALPMADQEVLARVEDAVCSLPSLGELFAEGKSPGEVIMSELADFDPIIIGERRVDFYCHCSKERFAGFLAALPEDQLRDIKENGPFPLVTTCLNCNTAYSFSEHELEVLYNER
jgi:molecular chaperone Hsp33